MKKYKFRIKKEITEGKTYYIPQIKGFFGWKCFDRNFNPTYFATLELGFGHEESANNFLNNYIDGNYKTKIVKEIEVESQSCVTN